MEDLLIYQMSFVFFRRELSTNVSADDVDIDHDLLTIHYAAYRGHVQCIQSCLDRGTSVDQLSRELERTALIVAVREGNVMIARFLLQCESDPEKCDTGGNTAITHAVLCDRGRCIVLLAQFGAEINPTDDDGDDDHTNDDDDDYDADESVMRAQNRRPPIMLAALLGQVDCMKILLQCGAKLNMYGDDRHQDWDLLDRTMWERLQIETIEEILLLILNVEGCLDSVLLKMYLFRTLRTVPITVEAVRRMLSRGIVLKYPNGEPNINFNWMLTSAIRWMSPPNILRCILEHADLYNLDVNRQDSIEELLPLHLACKDPTLDGLYRLKELLLGGADPNKETVLNDFFIGTRRSGLDQAIMYGNFVAARMLLLVGARRYNPVRRARQPAHRSRHVDENTSSVDALVAENIQTPLSLSIQCRVVTRQSIGRNTSDKLQSLPVPNVMREFLALRDLDEILTSCEKTNKTGWLGNMPNIHNILAAPHATTTMPQHSPTTTMASDVFMNSEWR